MQQVYKKQFIVLSEALVEIREVEVAPGQKMLQRVNTPQFFDTIEELTGWLDKHFIANPGDYIQIKHDYILEADIEIGYEEIGVTE